MIIGTGIDIVEIERLEKSITKYGDSFLAHFLTADEIASLPKGGHRLQACAGRWAAKEAVAKALGTGFGGKCAWCDLTIYNDEAGAPHVQLSGAAAQTASEKRITTMHISISHEQKYACAMAIAEQD